MLCKYDMNAERLGVGMIFRFTVYNHNTPFMIGDFINEINYWCSINIDDASLYDITETILGCWVTIYDNDYAVGFKLKWT